MKVSTTMLHTIPVVVVLAAIDLNSQIRISSSKKGMLGHGHRKQTHKILQFIGFQWCLESTWSTKTTLLETIRKFGKFHRMM